MKAKDHISLILATNADVHTKYLSLFLVLLKTHKRLLQKLA